MKIKIDNHFYTISPDVILHENYDDYGKYYKPFIIYEQYPAQRVLAILWERHEQDAFDEAVDNNLLDDFLVDTSEFSEDEFEEAVENYSALCNTGEYFDLEFVRVKELPPFEIDFLTGVLSGLKRKGFEVEE